MHGVASRVALTSLLLTGSALAQEPKGDLLTSLREISGNSPTIHFGDDSHLTFGLRTQFLFAADEIAGTNDINVRRTRLKAKGSIFPETSFKFEWKLDDVGREGKTSKAQAEDISFFYHAGEDTDLRVGLFDAPFSRESLTSDSKLLFVDRSMLHDHYRGLGLADNAIGVQLSSFTGGSFEYHVGIFDNESYNSGETSHLMPMARVVAHLLDREKGEYKASRPGSDQSILNLGCSVGMLDSIDAGAGEFDVLGAEVDLYGSLDNGFSFEAQYGMVDQDSASASDVSSEAYYAQVGYRLADRLGKGLPELAYRFQSLDADTDLAGDRSDAHSVGFNWYLAGHNLKFQTDYTLFQNQGSAEDGGLFRIQLQLDF